jgi:allantoinase
VAAPLSASLPPGRFDYAPINDRPIIRWPNNARVAFWVAPNMEFFEYLPQNRPTQPDIPLYSRMDYGNRVGFWRMLDVLHRHKLGACCCLNLEILDHFPEIKDAMVAANWDYMVHGLYNSRPIYDLSEEEERLLAGLHRPSAGDDRQAPEGATWRRRRVHDAHRRSDGRGGLSLPHLLDHRRPTLADQCPRRPEVHLRSLHRPNQRRRHARLEPRGRPFPADDQGPVRHALPRGRGRVMCLSLHPHNIGRPNAAKHLDEALRYILGHDGVWATTADDIAEYYLSNYYDQVKSWIAEPKPEAAS